MKKALLLLIILVSGFLLGIPFLVFRGFSGGPAQPAGDEQFVRVLQTQTGKVVRLPLEEYLVGVVAAEMPANYAPEALKALAVTARTYTVRRMFASGAAPSAGHPEAEVCTGPEHCQAWDDDNRLKEKWGKLRYYIYVNKIRTAVKATRGQVITYQNTVIDPVYHASCGGRGTENSEDVWSYEIPYLRGVACSAEHGAAGQDYTAEFDKEELLSLVKNAGPEPVPALTETASFLQPGKRSARGRLQEIGIFGRRLSGTDLRQALGLTSTLISWQVNGGIIRFTSTGKGHAVGLCQAGANGLALAGHDYQAIISHYYSGVKIQRRQD